VSSLGVEIGGRTVPGQPLQQTRTGLDNPREDVFSPPVEEDAIAVPAGPAGRVAWSTDASARLERVPSFVRGMVKRIYTDYARERSIPVVTTEVMDRARTDLGLEGL
jgi:hypothetical protein